LKGNETASKYGKLHYLLIRKALSRSAGRDTGRSEAEEDMLTAWPWQGNTQPKSWYGEAAPYWTRLPAYLRRAGRVSKGR